MSNAGTPKVSVVIATFNAGQYLQAAVNSVLGQTVSDLELIVVDDGSTDGSVSIFESIEDDRLKVIHQQNSGQTHAKNRGIEEARGEIIGFCDADDYWYPDKLELQLPLFDKSPRTGVVYSEAEKIDELGMPIESLWANPHRGAVLDQLFMRNFVPFGTALVRRECLQSVGAFDEQLRMGIDWDLWLRISTRYEFDFVEDHTYAYRVWPGQMSTNWRGRYDCAFRIMDKFIKTFPGTVSSRIYRKARANTYANKARARVREMPLAAIGDSFKAIALDPMELFNWKTVARVPLDAADTHFARGVGENRSGRFATAKRVGAPLVRLVTRGTPRILMFHRFGASSSAQRHGVDDFRRQLKYLADRCVVLPLAEALDLGQSTHNRKPVVVITVDDGYSDFIEFAYPALSDYKFRATLFVTSGFVDRQFYLWPDLIRALLMSVPIGSYVLDGVWAGTKLDIRGPRSREASWHNLADKLLFTKDEIRNVAINELAHATGLVLSELDMSQYSALTWSDLKSLSKDGVEIGDHTWSHPHLPLLSPDELRIQLARSKSVIEGHIGNQLRSIAYPNGTLRDYSSGVIEIINSLGFDYAVTSVPSKFDSEHPHEIGRLSGSCGMRDFRNAIAGYELIFNRNSRILPRRNKQTGS